MKYLITVFVFGFASSIATSAYAQQKNNSIFGSWQLISSTSTNKGIVTTRDSTTDAQYKMITPTWFMFSAFRKGTDTLIMSTAGPLTYAGKEMTHTGMYSTSKARVGITATYSVEVKGNLLYQKGKIGNTELNEVWVRMY